MRDALRAHFATAIAEGHYYDSVSIVDRVVEPIVGQDRVASPALPTYLSMTIPRRRQNRSRRHGADLISPTVCAAYLSIPVFSQISTLWISRSPRCASLLKSIPRLPFLRNLTLDKGAVQDLIAHCQSLSLDVLRDAPELSILTTIEVICLSNFDCDQV